MTVEDDLVAIESKARGTDPLQIAGTVVDLEEAITATAMEVVVVILARYLVAVRTSR
jgi:hypothetical protein